VFVTGPVHHYWLTRFNPADRDESVGVLLQREVIARAFAAGAARVDLMLGDQAHKRRWTTGSYGTVNVYAAPTRAGLLLGMAVLGVAARARATRARVRGPRSWGAGDRRAATA